MGMFLADGATDYLTTPGNYTRAESNHTISVWLRQDSGGNMNALGNHSSWRLRGRSSPVIEARLLTIGPRADVGINDDELNHYVFTVDIIGNEARSYKDGQLIATSIPVFTGPRTGEFCIGRYHASFANGWFGTIDDVRIYEEVLSPSRIENIFNGRGSDSDILNLSHWYKMDEGNDGDPVTTLYDSVGGMHLTNAFGSPIYRHEFGLKTRKPGST